jgi:hypothetical protein
MKPRRAKPSTAYWRAWSTRRSYGHRKPTVVPYALRRHLKCAVCNKIVAKAVARCLLSRRAWAACPKKGLRHAEAECVPIHRKCAPWMQDDYVRMNEDCDQSEFEEPIPTKLRKWLDET